MAIKYRILPRSLSLGLFLDGIDTVNTYRYLYRWKLCLYGNLAIQKLLQDARAQGRYYYDISRILEICDRYQKTWLLQETRYRGSPQAKGRTGENNREILRGIYEELILETPKEFLT